MEFIGLKDDEGGSAVGVEDLQDESSKDKTVAKRRFPVDLTINDYVRHSRIRAFEGDGYFGEDDLVSEKLSALRSRISDMFDATTIRTVRLLMSSTKTPRQHGINSSSSTSSTTNNGYVLCRVVCGYFPFNEIEASLERLLMAIVRSVLADRINNEYWLDVTVIMAEQNRRLMVKVTLPFYRPGCGCIHVSVQPFGNTRLGSNGEIPCRGNRKGHRCRIGAIQGHKFHAHYRRKVEGKRENEAEIEQIPPVETHEAPDEEEESPESPNPYEQMIASESFNPSQLSQRISVRYSQLQERMLADAHLYSSSVLQATGLCGSAGANDEGGLGLGGKKVKDFPDMAESDPVDDLADLITHYFTGCLEYYQAVAYNRALLLLHIVLKYGEGNLDIPGGKVSNLENECARALFYFTVEILSGRLDHYSKKAWEVGTSLESVQIPNVDNCMGAAHYASMSAFVCLQLDHQFADDEAVTRCPNAASVPASAARRKPFVLQPTGSIRNRLLLLLGFLRHARSQQRRFSSAYCALAFPRDLDSWILLALKLIHLIESLLFFGMGNNSSEPILVSGHFEPDVVSALYHLLNRIESTHLRKSTSDPVTGSYLRLHHVECLINYVRRLLGTTGHIEIVQSSAGEPSFAEVDALANNPEKSLVLFIPDPAAASGSPDEDDDADGHDCGGNNHHHHHH